MGTCCSTDSRPVNADAEVDNMSLKPINPPKNRQAHSRTTDQDLPQGVSNPETKAQEIQLLLQQSDQEGHRSGGKSYEAHGSHSGHYGGEERRSSYRENDRYYQGRHGEREERYRDDDRHNNDSRVEQRDHNERSIREERGSLKENEYAVSEQNVLTEEVGEKPAPENEHHEVQLTVEEVIREEEHGVTYYINANTQGLIRIHVAASEAKSNIQEIEAKIKSQNENLRSISISFNGQETENMDYFITELLKTSTYTSINIVFGKLSTFSEQGLQAFSDIIANSPLEKLYIMHASHDATDSFFATVMPAVQACKETLKELSIQSGNCQELSDDAIKQIAKAIEWNQVLEYVALYFGNTTKITDNAISELRSAFNLKAQLKKLELGFLNLTQLTDEALVSFCEIVEDLRNLVDVSIITPGAGFSPAKYQKFEAVINNFKVQNVNLYWDD